MKYIDADRLRAEIERKIHEISHPLKDGYEVQSIGKIEGLSELLEIIDSLQQEQPEVDSEKPVPNDLEERWDELQTNFREINEAFEAGKKEQREQMMKEAVEGEITKDNRGNNVLRVGSLNNGFEIGDKVRIIIVKEYFVPNKYDSKSDL